MNSKKKNVIFLAMTLACQLISIVMLFLPYVEIKEIKEISGNNIAMQIPAFKYYVIVLAVCMLVSMLLLFAVRSNICKIIAGIIYGICYVGHAGSFLWMPRVFQSELQKKGTLDLFGMDIGGMISNWSDKLISSNLAVGYYLYVFIGAATLICLLFHLQSDWSPVKNDVPADAWDNSSFREDDGWENSWGVGAGGEGNRSFSDNNNWDMGNSLDVTACPFPTQWDISSARITGDDLTEKFEDGMPEAQTPLQPQQKTGASSKKNVKKAHIQGVKGVHNKKAWGIKAGKRVSVGRDASQCEIIIDKPTISRVHCYVFYDGDKECFFVTNLSANGTYIFRDNRKFSIEKGQVGQVNKGEQIGFGDCSDMFWMT